MPSPTFKTLRVLIVDDADEMRRMLRAMLSLLDVLHVEEASDGNEALDRLRAGGKYEMIISDWKMEPMSGFELLERVRCDEALGRIPFILISGNSDPDTGSAALKAGASAFLAKPFEIGDLRAAIIDVLTRW
jgi:two-component system chemotaxis response regulator CheY